MILKIDRRQSAASKNIQIDTHLEIVTATFKNYFTQSKLLCISFLKLNFHKYFIN